ncbi:MAG: GNAT family N-acetyltransferase [Phycisphaerales bacterium]|nr:GNAT family N-acetyltransferase [Phycisphaerales bacterium]
MSKRLAIVEITAEQTREVRRAVLRPHQDASELVYPGDDDRESFHLGVVMKEEDGETIVAILSMYHAAREGEASGWRIRGMASVAKVRSMGYGRELVEMARERAWGIDRAEIWCNARESAFGFYEKLGFVVVGDLFEIEGIGTHAVMVLEEGTGD